MSRENDQNFSANQPVVKSKQTLYFTEIRRSKLVNEIRMRRVEQVMSEEQAKDSIQKEYKEQFAGLLKGFKSTEEFSLKTKDMKEVLESVSDTRYFNTVLAEHGFYEHLLGHLKIIDEDRLYNDPKYEDTINTCLWFFCNAMKFYIGFELFCEKKNFEIVHRVSMEVVSALCLATYANFVSNFILALAERGFVLKLIDLNNLYYSSVAKRLEQAMSEIGEMEKTAIDLIDASLFFFSQSKTHLNVDIAVPKVS